MTTSVCLPHDDTLERDEAHINFGAAPVQIRLMARKAIYGIRNMGIGMTGVMPSFMQISHPALPLICL